MTQCKQWKQWHCGNNYTRRLVTGKTMCKGEGRNTCYELELLWWALSGTWLRRGLKDYCYNVNWGTSVTVAGAGILWTLWNKGQSQLGLCSHRRGELRWDRWKWFLECVCSGLLVSRWRLVEKEARSGWVSEWWIQIGPDGASERQADEMEWRWLVPGKRWS